MQIFEVGDGRCEVEVTETQDRGGSVAVGSERGQGQKSREGFWKSKLKQTDQG